MNLDDEPNMPFETRLRNLKPRPCGEALKRRIAAAIDQSITTKQPSRARRQTFRNSLYAAPWLGGGAALLWFYFLRTAPEADSIERGRQSIVLLQSGPELVLFPDSQPMWKISYQTLEKDFFQTPAGMAETCFTSHEHTVYSPLQYQ